MRSGARPDGALTISQARRRIADTLRQRGFESPELDARLIVGHAIGLDHTALVAAADRMLSAEQVRATAALAERRLAHEPVARILGWKEFWGLPFRLDADTLVPRPETETVVEVALACVDRSIDQRLRLADLGTGSGAILLALLSELPNAFGVGTDLSEAALRCARDNAAALGFSHASAFVACSYGAALAPPFDLVVSNPPYVASGDVVSLQPEVALFDPRRALDGGADGLDAYRALASDARRLLAPGGTLVAELGAGQHEAVAALFGMAGLAVLPPHYDLSGVPRALAMRRLP